MEYVTSRVWEELRFDEGLQSSPSAPASGLPYRRVMPALRRRRRVGGPSHNAEILLSTPALQHSAAPFSP